METLFFEVVNRSIAAGWLILAIILLRLILRKAPKWIHCSLWALVGIRLISPFSFESIISLIPSKETISPSIVYAQSPAIHTGISSLNYSVNPIITATFAPDPATSANPLQILAFIFSFIWITGVTLLLLYALISWMLLRKKVSASVRVDKNIWLCDTVSTPFILGVVRPRIYLPSDLDSDTRSSTCARKCPY